MVFAVGAVVATVATGGSEELVYKQRIILKTNKTETKKDSSKIME